MRVYAAHPMTSYHSAHGAEQLAGIAKALPGVEIVDPEQSTWATNADWLRDWPAILGSLAGLVVFADTLGTVGVGCLHEVTDAVMAGVPVAGWHPKDGMVELVGFELLDAGRRSALRAAFLVLGGSLDLATFPTPTPEGTPERTSTPTHGRADG